MESVKYDRSDIRNIAYEHGLEVIETTNAMNGYPINLKLGLVGFDTFEDATKLGNKLGLDICHFYKKNGWDLWYRNDLIAYKPLTPCSEDFGDDYKEYYPDMYDNLEDFYQQEGSYIRDNINSFNFKELHDQLDRLELLYSNIEELEDDEVLITDGDSFNVFKKELMRYSYDSQTHVIGLINL